MEPAELGQHRQQVEHGEFVGGDEQSAFLQLAQFGERLGGFTAEVDQLLGIFEKNLAGVGKDALTRRAVEKRLAKLVLQFADGLADGGLGAEELFGCAREGAFSSYRQKDFELGKLHEITP